MKVRSIRLLMYISALLIALQVGAITHYERLGIGSKATAAEVSAACSKKKNKIAQKIQQATVVQRAQLVPEQKSVNIACGILENPRKRVSYDLAQEAKMKSKSKKGKEKEEPSQPEGTSETPAERPKESDPYYIDKMRKFLADEFIKQKKDVDVKIFNLIRNFLTKINIPGAGVSIFNNNLAFKNMQFTSPPSGRDIRAGIGFTGITQFNNFPVKGTVYIVQDKSKKLQYSVAVELTENYKISHMFPLFRKLDVLTLPKGQFVASTFKYVDANGYAIEKGFNFVSSLELDGPLRALGELRKKAKDFDAIAFDFEAPIYIHGVISSITTVSFDAVIPIRLGIDFKQVKNFPKEFSSIIQKITTDDMKIGVSISPMDQKLTAQTGIQIILGHQKEPFRIQGFGGVDITTGKINFGGKMPDMLELKFIAIGDMKIELYLDPAVESILIFFGVPVSGIALGGQIDLGKKGKTRVSLEANGKLSLEVKKLADFVLEVEAQNIQFAEIVSLLTKMAEKSGIPGAEIPASKLPVMNINRLYGRIAPWDTEIANKKIAAGFQLALDAELFGKKFGFDVNIKHKDLVFSGMGYMSEVVFKSGSKTIFKLSGPGPDKRYGTSDDGPVVACSFNAKKPQEGSFSVATYLSIPPVGVSSLVDLQIAASKFKADFETKMLGFTVVFGVSIDPTKLKEMYVRLGFKGDFAGFLSKQAGPAIQELKKEATAELAKIDRKIGELAGELKKLEREQTRIQREGVSATEQEIRKTRDTIRRIERKIRSLKRECDNAPWYRKLDICAKVGTEIFAQANALAAQNVYLNRLLKPGREAMKITTEALNAINKSIQTTSQAISRAKVLQQSAEGVLNGLNKALEGISKGLEIFKVTEAVGEFSAKDLSEGKLPKLISLKAEVNIPELPKASVSLKDLQFDFKNPLKSGVDIAKKLVKGVEIG